MTLSTEARTFDVIVKFADAEGWVGPGGIHARPSFESNPFLAIIGGAMRGDYTYADIYEDTKQTHVLLVHNSTVWGVAGIVRIAPDRFFDGVRRLIVDPMDAPCELQDLVGTRVPPIRKFTTATFADGVLTYKSGVTNV